MAKRVDRRRLRGRNIPSNWTVLRVHSGLQEQQPCHPAAGGCTPYRADDAAHPWLPDYPKMGIWPDGLYMTTNMFDCLNPDCSSASYKEVRVYAFDRADMYAGAPLSSIVVDLNTTALLQPAAEQPARRACRRPREPPRRRVGYGLRVQRVEVPRRLGHRPPTRRSPGPTASSARRYYNLPVSVPSADGRLCSTRSATGCRMQNSVPHLGGTESLWVNHTVRSGGVGNAERASSGRTPTSPCDDR